MIHSRCKYRLSIESYMYPSSVSKYGSPVLDTYSNLQSAHACLNSANAALSVCAVKASLDAYLHNLG